MAHCDQCGAEFDTLIGGWGDSTCGGCLAARIDLALALGARTGERKPPRRAPRRTSVEPTQEIRKAANE